MENAVGRTSRADDKPSAARNSRAWKAWVTLIVLWSLVTVPMIWGILRAFDGANYLVPQG